MSLIHKERSSKYYLFTEGEMHALSDYYIALPLFVLSAVLSFVFFVFGFSADSLLELFLTIMFWAMSVLSVFGVVHTYLCYRRLIDTVIAETEAGK